MKHFSRISAALFVVTSVAVCGGNFTQLNRSENDESQPRSGEWILSDPEQLAKQPKYRPSPFHGRTRRLIPPTFDARLRWPNCTSIRQIRNQLPCGTCWAVSSTSVISDRICIASGQKKNIFISANQAAACVYPSRTVYAKCHKGGSSLDVFKWASMYGLPTGGESGDGCVPYQSSENLTCWKSCSNKNYSIPMDQDNYIIDSYYLSSPLLLNMKHKMYNVNIVVMSDAQIKASVLQMQTDIMAKGPIVAALKVYDDFKSWTPDKGIYRGPSKNATFVEPHLARIIGWNKDKNGDPYWLISNSYGTAVGDKGIFWVHMGNNTCGIEAYVAAPIVTMVNACKASTFCTAPIDHAVSFESSSTPDGPSYLFQGSCVHQVKVMDGKVKAVGQPEPYSKVFMAIFPGPIVHHIREENGTVVLINLVLTDSLTDSPARAPTIPGRKKFDCIIRKPLKKAALKLFSTQRVAYYFRQSARSWKYKPDFPSFLTDADGIRVNLAVPFADEFSTVDLLFDLDGTKMLVA